MVVVTTILNFAPAIQPNDTDFFADVDYLILNEVEAQQLSGLDVSSVENAKIASLALLDKLNVQTGVIITLGELGVLYTDKAKRSSYHKKCPEVDVVDTTVRIFCLQIVQFFCNQIFV